MIKTGIAGPGRLFLGLLYLNVLLGLAWWGQGVLARRAVADPAPGGTPWMSPASFAGDDGGSSRSSSEAAVRHVPVLPDAFLEENERETIRLDQEIRRALASRWTPPAVLLPPDRRTATLSVVVGQDEKVAPRVLAAPSGHAALDFSVVAAAALLGELPPPPGNLADGGYEVRVDFRIE